MNLRPFVLVAMAVLAAAALGTVKPSAQGPFGQCGYIQVGGSPGGGGVFGYAQVDIYPNTCFGEGSPEGARVYAAVTVTSPWGATGSDAGYDDFSGFVRADAFAEMAEGEYGLMSADGEGAICAFEWWCEQVTDTWRYETNPPPPDPDPSQCTVSGMVFVDHNRNGAFDGSDAPVSGTTVYLADSSNTYVIETFVTGSSGGYEFGGLEEAGYRVIHPVPSGYDRTTDDSVAFSACNFSHNFGIAGTSPVGQGTASGVVFFDYNYNGVFDEGEDPVSGTTVYLSDPANTYVISTYTTGSSGGYQFQGLAEGSYRVTHPVPDGYVRTTDDSIAFSAANFAHNFGIAQDPPPQTPPVLRLFVDAEPYDFSESNPQSEDGIYVPGAREDGSSVPVSEIQAGQQVRVYAAFVNPANPNQIVAPPANVSVTFTLNSISSWTGYAMNQGTDTEPDFTFQGSAQNIGFTGNLVQVILLCKDYGGSVTVGASASNGVPTDPIRLPRDTNNNWLPDNGWKVATGTGLESVLDNVADPWSDTDGDIGPIGSPVPPADVPLNFGWYGDGLILFHEYRGFVVRGNHNRTDPTRLDIFMSHNVVNGTQRVDDALAFAKSSLNDFRITLHELYDQTEQGFTAEYLQGPGGPVNLNVGHNPVIAGYPGTNSYQRALRIVNGTPTGAWGETLGSCLPSAPSGQPQQSGLIPLNVSSMAVNVTALFNQGSMMPAFTTAMVLNEVRKTVAHEIGHGIHMSHRPHDRPNAVPRTQCPDSATLGSAVSVMNNNLPLNGQDGSFAGSRYNTVDIRQIRLHLRPNP